MRIHAILIAVLFMAVSAMLISCGRSVDPEPQPPDDLVDLQKQLEASPRENEEVELMAMWLGREVAHTRDYNRILAALNLVRDEYREMIPQLDSIEFTYFSEVGKIIVFMTDPAIAQLRSGTYSDWDSLNTLYRVTDIDTTQLAENGGVYLTFQGRLKPELMGPIYSSLSSIWHFGMNVRGGDWSNLYPWPVGDYMTFLLRRADGDCPAGCINSHFWYFKVRFGQVVYVGEYEYDQRISFPDWWSEAKLGFCAYFDYRHGYCDQ